MIMHIHITIKTKKASNAYKKAKTKIINSGNWKKDAISRIVVKKLH